MFSNNIRLFYSILLFILIIGSPWWIYLPVLLIGVIIFPLYIEGIFYGFIIDAVYGVSQFGNNFLNFPIALISTLIVLIFIPLREKIRFHA